MHDSPFLPKINKPEKELPKKGRPILIPSLLALIALLVCTSLYLGWMHFYNKPDPTEDVVTAVGKLIDLPNGEVPSVATVTDPTTLGKQEFFKDAQVGDRVLVFSQSKKAILYRPSENKIIVVAPLIK